MACTALTRGRPLDCNRVSGGVKEIYFAVSDQVTSTTEASGEITEVNMGANSIYKYVVPRGATTVSETITGSTENGTIFYTPTVTMVLNKLTKEDQNELKLLGQTQVIIFALLNATKTSNGQNVILCLGRTNFMQLNAGSEDSGVAFGDRNGYTLTFDGLEEVPMGICKDYTTDPFDNLGASGVAIPIVS
tara:strand:+ start:8012 stop:8581 length:570 start_codon:yes stop_codon:yes gene_type:complete